MKKVCYIADSLPEAEVFLSDNTEWEQVADHKFYNRTDGEIITLVTRAEELRGNDTAKVYTDVLSFGNLPYREFRAFKSYLRGRGSKTIFIEERE